MPYFHISHGMRGCYMPDSHDVLYVKTRKALKAIVSDEVAFLDYPFGGSKAEVARVVAAIWRDLRATRRQYLDFAIPLGNDRRSRPFAIFLSHATRGEYREAEKNRDL